MDLIFFQNSQQQIHIDFDFDKNLPKKHRELEQTMGSLKVIRIYKNCRVSHGIAYRELWDELGLKINNTWYSFEALSIFPVNQGPNASPAEKRARAYMMECISPEDHEEVPF